MEALLQMGGLISIVLSLVVLIVFFVMASNIGTLVTLIRHQNKVLEELYKLNGGKILDPFTKKPK
jgi:hypothetical protein